MHTVRGDGVTSIKRRRRDLYGDSVKNLATMSGRGRLKEDLESSTWRRRKERRPGLFQFSLQIDQASDWLGTCSSAVPIINTWGIYTTRESLISEAWTRFKDLLQKVPHHGIDRWLQIQTFYDHVSFHPSDEDLTTPRARLTHIPQAYAEAVYSNPRPQNQNGPPKQNPSTFRERIGPNPQPQALGTTFEARVQDYMAAHTERMEKFENTIFKQREEINDRMAEMFGLLKELTTRRAPKKSVDRNERLIPPFTKTSKFYDLCPKERRIGVNKGDMARRRPALNGTHREMLHLKLSEKGD
ncbi:hypothetical protein Tco_1346511 [Tanacetum coccineum]